VCPPTPLFPPFYGPYVMLATNIVIADAARRVLERSKSNFQPAPGSVFALCYEPAFINRDGTTVEGFVPGYAVVSWPNDHIGPGWLLVLLARGIEFYLMPRFKWRATETYVMDLASAEYETFSIASIGR
jgi:hypothetical protein